VTGYTVEIGIELSARNKIYLQPQITVGKHQNSFLRSIKASSLGIRQLDDEEPDPIRCEFKNIWRDISNFLRTLAARLNQAKNNCNLDHPSAIDIQGQGQKDESLPVKVEIVPFFLVRCRRNRQMRIL